jgi:hypothetical protein
LYTVKAAILSSGILPFGKRWPLANFVQFELHKISFSRVDDMAKAPQKLSKPIGY